MKLSLGISPCPNDTFIFDALINKKIDTQDFDFEVYLEDVQTLNNRAKQGKYDISKISYGVWPLLQEQYSLLDAGGALGKGVGPLLISREPVNDLSDLNNKVIAIPGINTTAHVLFSLAFPDVQHKKFMVFSDIESAVLNGEVDAGVIIHENRFTYQLKGLIKLMDLGDYWEKTTNSPIPLGGIVVKKDLGSDVQEQINSLIQKSLEYSFATYPVLSDYIKQHAQEMDEAVMRQHIELYVNDFSMGLGEEGRRAVDKLMEVYLGSFSYICPLANQTNHQRTLKSNRDR